MEYSEEYMRDYLLGRLSPEETSQLEKELKQDSELAEALELQRDIMQGIRAGFDDELRQKLLKLDRQIEGESNVRSLGQRALWRWASAAAVLLGTLGVYLYMNQTSMEERIFLTYFEDFPNIIEPVQRDRESESTAFSAYQNRNYQEAFEAFSDKEKTTPEALYATFYKGICALHLEDWKVAIDAFERVRSTSDNRFEEAATWYAGLAYLRSGDQKTATLILEALADSPGNFQKEAMAILDQLR